jgi:NADPH:quinone reductase-like Zn-dependent oxidoreductase
MKAIVLTEGGGPEALQVREVETPAPKLREVRVALRASALNRRDLTVSWGKHVNTLYPCVLGSDGVGVIDAVGEGVDAGLIGREVVLYPAREWGDDQRCYGKNFRVLGMPDPGTFADYCCAPASDIADKPAHLTWEQAAAVPLAGLTAWRSVVTHGEVGPGMRVLVTGAGSGVSTFAIQWAAKLGADVYVTSGAAEKIEKAIALGAKGGVSYRDEGFAKQLRAMSGGFDVIVDSAGGDSVGALLDILRPAGRYIFFGATLGNPSAPLDLRRMFLRQSRIQSTTMGSPEEFKAMIAFVAREKIEPVIDRVLPLADVAVGLKLMEGFAQTGKIVLRNAG